MDASGPATADPRAPAALAPRPTWWREGEFWLVLLIVIGIYFTRPTALSIRGEESRWANVAREMLASGDFVVPREQGEVFANRPPLTNWLLAGFMSLTGRQDAWTVRFPSLLATLGTSLLIYVCGRSFLSRFGAMVGACAFATMGQVLQLGRHAESEPILTLFVAASLLGWLAFYLTDRSPLHTWLIGYGFAALAGLAKGPQGPVYFLGATWLFLLVNDRRYLLSRGHVAGIALFLAIIGVWQVPLMRAVGFDDAWRIWSSEAGRRLTESTSAGRAVVHALRFPWEVLGCMLPWSGLLLGYFDKTLRSKIPPFRRPVSYLAIASIVGLVPLLLTSQARGRYFMPLAPCTALLAALVVELSVGSAPVRRAAKAWPIFIGVCGAAAPAAAVFVVAASTVPHWSSGPYAQTWSTATFFALAAAATAWVCRKAIYNNDRRLSQSAAVAIAAFCGFTSTVVLINAHQLRSNDPQPVVAELSRRLPADTQLVSFGTIHHLFAYHLAETGGRTVARTEEPSTAAPLAGNWEYFCLNSYEPLPNPLPFAWEQVAVVPVDRNRYSPPRDYVVVGRRLSSVAQHKESSEAAIGAPSAAPPARPPALEASKSGSSVR